MLDTTLSPTLAGILHRNHMAMIAEGPWDFLGLEPARYTVEANGDERPICAGTCAICGQAICDVVRVRQRVTREVRILGLDCADTFGTNIGKARAFAAARKGLAKAKREATTRRKVARLADELAPLRAEMEAWTQEESFRANVARSAIRVMDKGRRPSPNHIALIEKLRAELPAVEAPKPVRPEPEKRTAAPTGPQVVVGRVVAVKSEDVLYGRAKTTTYRMTVKVMTAAGVYMVNSAIPRALLSESWEKLTHEDGAMYALKDCDVEFSATLTRSDRDEGFAFAARPTKARLVAWPEGRARHMDEPNDEPHDAQD